MPEKPIADEIDKRLINLIQSDFPIERRPFHEIAGKLAAEAGQKVSPKIPKKNHIDEAEVIQRIKWLKKNGMIRRIGGNFSPDKLGFVSTLCAARVPEPQLDRFAETVNRFPGVTHNYIRENRYNVWFTIIAPSKKHIEAILSSIRKKTGIDEILDLPATRVFKVRAHFKLPTDETAS